MIMSNRLSKDSRAIQLPRNRIVRAIDFRSLDKVPLRIFAAPGGLYEHGQKLVDLIKVCGHDFGDFGDLSLPASPGPEDFDPDGRYHAIETDEWGTTWEYRTFGVWGHPIGWPLADLSKLDNYKAPQALPYTKEILSILFDFSSSESFTIHISPKKLIAGPEGFVYT